MGERGESCGGVAGVGGGWGVIWTRFLLTGLSSCSRVCCRIVRKGLELFGIGFKILSMKPEKSYKIGTVYAEVMPKKDGGVWVRLVSKVGDKEQFGFDLRGATDSNGYPLSRVESEVLNDIREKHLDKYEKDLTKTIKAEDV